MLRLRVRLVPLTLAGALALAACGTRGGDARDSDAAAAAAANGFRGVITAPPREKPDFTLTDGEATIHVEVVAFWTDEYLARKRRALAEVTAPLLVCFDTSLGPLDAGAFGDKDVLPFRKTINASELVAKLDLMARRSGAAPPVVMPHRGSPRRLDETSSTFHHPGHRGDGSPD